MSNTRQHKTGNGATEFGIRTNLDDAEPEPVTPKTSVARAPPCGCVPCLVKSLRQRLAVRGAAHLFPALREEAPHRGHVGLRGVVLGDLPISQPTDPVPPPRPTDAWAHRNGVILQVQDAMPFPSLPRAKGSKIATRVLMEHSVFMCHESSGDFDAVKDAGFLSYLESPF